MHMHAWYTHETKPALKEPWKSILNAHWHYTVTYSCALRQTDAPTIFRFWKLSETPSTSTDSVLCKYVVQSTDTDYTTKIWYIPEQSIWCWCDVDYGIFLFHLQPLNVLLLLRLDRKLQGIASLALTQCMMWLLVYSTCLYDAKSDIVSDVFGCIITLADVSL